MTESMGQYGHIHMPFTIERQLMAYKSHPEHDIQHEVLWTTWCHNKRMLEQLLRWTLVSFPMYSRHDESHSTSVLRNMERILGEERIKRLSATDAFALLHVAYEHDIGMCITDADREKIVSSPEFLEMLERVSQGSDQMLAAYVQLIKGCCPEEVQPDRLLTEQETYHRTLRKNLKIYHAMTELLTMYQRAEHGQIAQRRLQETLTSPKSRLSEQFCVSDISNRIFYWIAECAALHTVWEFDEILRLPFEDDGAASDKLHPRFVAVMLQLGDALDMDCGRFPFLMEEFSGQLSAETKKHLKKHESIRMLCISDRKIEVRANCEDHGVSRLIQAECRGIDQILRNASYHWSEIAPEDLPGMLPSFELSEMTVQGARIPPQLINASFRISQKKAFSLLEGSNIYMHKLVFLREILQNAFDATKLQYWKDYLGLLSPRDNGSVGAVRTSGRGGSEVLFDAAKRLPLEHYPVVVKLTVCSATGENAYDPPATAAKAADIMDNFARSPYHNFGVRVEVQDCGIGIGESDLSFIANLGTESKDRQNLKAHMPDVLYPTGSFGIGLQSIFLAADHFHMRTRTKTGEAYDIRFSSMTGSEDGIINTTSLSNAATLPFGTKVTIDVSSKQKNTDPSIFPGSQVSYDPFVATEAEKELHEAEELLVQMVMFLNDILGERLFPLRVEVENLFSDQVHPWLGKMLADSRSLRFELTYALRGSGGQKEIRSPAHQGSALSWALLPDTEKKENCICNRPDSGDRYCLDLDEGKLHVWCDDVGAFATFSAARFCEIMEGREGGSPQRSIPLYYKGIKMSDSIPFTNNLDLLDFVDLKNKRTADILQLNRHYLTEEGKTFFSQTVGAAVMKTVRRVFLHMASDPYEASAETGAEKPAPIDQIHRTMKDSINALCDLNTPLSQEESLQIGRRMTSMILLLFLAKMLLHTDLVVNFQTCGAGTIRPMRECPWDRALRDMDSDLAESLWEKDDRPIIRLQRMQAFQKACPFFWVLIDIWGDNGLNDSGNMTTLAELFSSNHRYAVFSLREGPSSQDDTKYRILQFRTEPDKFEEEVQKAANSAKPVSTSSYRANNWDEAILRYQENLARWLVQNIPTAQFYTQHYTPDSGRSSYQSYLYELHVLEVASVRWIETNALTQYRLLECMRDQSANQNSARFATAVWSETLHCLAISQEAVSSMCTVYPEPIPAYSIPKVLIPLDAGRLKDLMEERPENILDKLGEDMSFYDGKDSGAESDASASHDGKDSGTKSDASPQRFSAESFLDKFQEYERVRKQFITNLPMPHRLALDDWQHNMRSIPCKETPRELLKHFLRSKLDLNPKCFSDLSRMDIQTFQRCLAQIYFTVSASEETLAKAAKEASFELQRLLEQTTIFSQSKNVETLVQAFYYDRGRLEQVICELFIDDCQQKIKPWRKLPETLRLADYVAEHSTNRISRETALALNEAFYRNIVEIVAAHRSADFLARACKT